jgi:hypothetical protein
MHSRRFSGDRWANARKRWGSGSGLAVVLCLMLLATFNDLVRFNLF